MAAFGAVSADLVAILKELYPTGFPKDVLYAKSPFLAMVAKSTDEAYGDTIKCPILWTDPQGTSAAFGTAQTNATGSKYSAFKLDTIDYYGVTQITGRAIDKSKNDRGSFVRGLKSQMDGIMRQVGRRLTHNVFRNSGGAIGVVGSISTNTITLSNVRDVRYFEVGQVIVMSATDGTSGSVRAGSLTVSAVNRSTGVVTFTTNVTAGIAAAVAGDYCFIQGDFGLMMSGLDAWIPSSAPGATAFFGVDRSVDPTRLGGQRADLSTLPLDEAVQESLRVVTDEGGTPDVIVLSSNNWMNLAKLMGSKVVYSERSDYEGILGFRSLKVMGPSGDVDIIADPDAQSNVMWTLSMDSWKLYSMGDLVRLLDDDGMPYLRQSGSDGVEIRVVSRPQLGCSAPGHNGRFTI